VGTGSYLPERVMTNAHLEEMVDTTEEWIVSRTGMKERHIAADGEAASHMAAAAAARALESSGVAAESVDMLLVATSTPDMVFPSTGCLTQARIGASNAFCMDISAACSGFLYAMEVGRQFVATGSVDTVLVVGSEKMSSIVDWTDRGTCVLFGDAAGAVVLRAGNGDGGILTSVLGSDGNLGDLLKVPAGGSQMPASEASVRDNLHTIKMSGREVFKYAVNNMSAAADQALKDCGLTIDDVACIVPHQANQRIIQAIGQKVGAHDDQFYVNVDKYGNTSAASVGVALDEVSRSGRLKDGDLVLFVAFGAGFTWGATVMEWDRS
jgi:3-oxoacyl-[acyl-carrier-protein] synthase-3